MILLCGASGDPQIQSVARALDRTGAAYRILDTLTFPAAPRLTLTGTEVVLDGTPLPPVRAVYLRSLAGTPIALGVDAEAAMRENWYRTLSAFREKTGLLQGLLRRLEREGARVVNPAAADYLLTKPYQLHVLRREGMTVPESIVTNDPGAAAEFARGRAKLIYKPVQGGAGTRLLDASDLTAERLGLLANAPVLFQEFVPGENVRVYVVGARVVASAVIETTDEVDFRRGEGAVRPIPLPDPVARRCLRGAELIGLRFTAIDLKRDGDRWVFLEFNTSPMFAGFEAKSGFPIAEALARHLAGA